jgi:hypothetical protein
VTVLAIIVTALLAGAALCGAIWLGARPSRTGALAQAWGQLDDDEAKQEIEQVFPGATQPVDEATRTMPPSGGQ